jgi:hypothetical protein
MTPQPSLQRPTDASTVHRTRAAAADACLVAAALCCPLPSARWRRQPACCFRPSTQHPAPSARCLLANRDALLPPSVLQNSEQCAIRGFTMLCRCLRLHSCEPCLDRPAQPNPTPLSRRLDDSASGSDQNVRSLRSHCGVECGPAPNLPNCSRGLARLMLPTMTMACICAVFYLRHPCQQPCTLLQPASQNQISA